MLHVIETHAIEFRHMVIIQGVKHLSPLLATAHEAHLTQSAQLMRDGRLGHLELRGNLAHVHFAFEQNGNDPQARRVAESAKQVSQMGGGRFFEEHNDI